jgi:transcriptional regulator with XRE-family HTH domain
MVLTRDLHRNHNGVAMKLIDYLERTSTSRHEFAKTIGVSGETVRRYIAGTRIPEKEKMEKIAEATGNAVTANDFFGIAA